MSDLQTFLEGLLQTRDPLRSVLPEGWPRHRAEHLTELIAYLFQGLPVVVDLEVSCGRWAIVVSREGKRERVAYDG